MKNDIKLWWKELKRQERYGLFVVIVFILAALILAIGVKVGAIAKISNAL